MDSLKYLDDQSVVEGMCATHRVERGHFARVLLFIAEADARKLHLKEGYSSLTAFVSHRLSLKDWEVGARVTMARLIRRFPKIYEVIERGELCPTTITKLGPVLTDENHRELLARAKGLTTREVEKLAVSIRPRSDSVELSPIQGFDFPGAASARQEATPIVGVSDEQVVGSKQDVRPLFQDDDDDHGRSREKVRFVTPVVVEMTLRMDEALLQDLEEAQAILRKPGQKVDKTVALRRVLAFFLDRHDPKRRLERKLARRARQQAKAATSAATMPATKTDGGGAPGSTGPSRPDDSKAPIDKVDPPTGKVADVSSSHEGIVTSRRVPKAVEDQVRQRDEHRCTFVAKSGVRCAARHRLEIDHERPYALGGSSTDPQNLRLRCKAHNALAAEQSFGADVIARAVSFRATCQRARHGSGGQDSGQKGSGRYGSVRSESVREDSGRQASGRQDSGRQDSGRQDSWS